MTTRQTHFHNAHVLVVDDDHVFREIVESLLAEVGITPQQASDGQAALEMIAAAALPFDLILMDIEMPVMNGFDACAEMKKRPDARHVPVLMITGLNDDESVDRAYQVGAVDFITKPVHWAILRNRVGYLLRDLEAERKLYLASSVFDNTNEGIVVTGPDASIQSINPAFTRITGYTPEEALGNSIQLIQSDRHEPAFYDKVWETLVETGKWQGEFWSQRKDGHLYPQWLTISTIRGPGGGIQNFVGVFSDLTALKESEESLLHLLGHDTLTDLPNRHLFQEHLSFALADAQGGGDGCHFVAGPGSLQGDQRHHGTRCGGSSPGPGGQTTHRPAGQRTKPIDGGHVGTFGGG